ncbi:MAG: thioredoxin family protein [Bacteroidales bacterium]|nr:thioredoxin family protein [Bacteroidales bacterium]
MKKFGIVGILALSLLINAKSQDLKWHTLEEAVALNKENPKKIMIDFYTDWCGWCKKMDAGTFNHPAIVDAFNKYFYVVKFNAESKGQVEFNGNTYRNVGEGRSTHMFAATFASMNGRIGYPTIVFFDENLTRLSVEPGYKDAKSLEPLLHYLGKNLYKSMSYTDFIKTFPSQIN